MPLTRAHLTHGLPLVQNHFHALNRRLSQLTYTTYRGLTLQQRRDLDREEEEVLATLTRMLPRGEARWKEWKWKERDW